MTDDTEPLWDAVVIGAGMGGATIGYSLARQGFRVLFLERGLSDVANGGNMEDPQARLRMAQWPDPVISEIDGRTAEHYVPLGTGGLDPDLRRGAGAVRALGPDDLPGLPHPHRRMAGEL